MFDWHAWIDLAEALLTDGAIGEAEWRCAVSRAYYAVFNFNRERLTASRRVSGSVESVHFTVWRALSASGDREENRLAIAARRLQSARIDADYHANVAFTLAIAQHWVALARRLVAETDALPR